MLGKGAVWGIDLAETGLKAVRMRKVAGRPVVLDFFIARYAELSQDPDLPKEQLIFLAVDSFMNRALLDHDRVFIGIPHQNVFTRFISLPPVEKRRVAELVQYEARQQIPFDLTDVTWDYQPVRKKFALGEEIEIGLFAVRREVIDGYMFQMQPLRHRLHGIQIAPLALYNFIQRDQNPEHPTVVLDIGGRSTDLIIIDRERFWTRNLPIAGESFTNLIAKKFNISHQEAERVKRRIGESRHRARIMELLTPVLRELSTEVQRSIGYYKSLSGEVKFEELVVLGDGFRMHGVSQFLSRNLQYPVRRLAELRELSFAGTERAAEFANELPALGVAIGLALQGLNETHITTNLLPEEFAVSRELAAKRPAALVAAVLIWIAVGILYISESRAVRWLDEMGSLGQATVEKANNYDKRHQDAMHHGDLPGLENLLITVQARDYWSEALSAISRVVPPHILVDQFQSQPQKIEVGFDGMGMEGMPEEDMGLDDAGGLMGVMDEGMGREAEVPSTGLGGMHFTFSVRTDAQYNEVELKVNLCKALETVRVYHGLTRDGQGVPLFKKVLVGRVRVEQAVRRGTGTVEHLPDEGPEDAGRWGDALRAPEAKDMISSVVVCAVNSPVELAQAVKDTYVVPGEGERPEDAGAAPVADAGHTP